MHGETMYLEMTKSLLIWNEDSTQDSYPQPLLQKTFLEAGKIGFQGRFAQPLQ
jgi:hypothetical protein